METVFFAQEGEKGLNLTSATHLCALASQIKAQDEAKLRNISFVNTYLSIVGNDGENQTNVGYTSEELEVIPEILSRIAKMNAFISWFAEARKALENYKRERESISIEDWAKEEGITMPEYPDNECLQISMSTLEDVMTELNIKERQEYLALEARSAVLGKFIHPDEPYESARTTMHNVSVKPYETRGSGRDTLIYRYNTSVEPVEVDNMFNKLQREYRRTEQSLNHMKADLRKRLEVRHLEETQKRQEAACDYKERVNAYHQEYREIFIKYEQWQKDEQVRLSKIKLAIPEALASTVEMLNHLAD